MSWADLESIDEPDSLDDFTRVQQMGFHVFHNDLEALQELLEEDKSVLQLLGDDNSTILHYTITKDRSEIFDFILDHNETPLDVVNNNGKTALNLSIILERTKYTWKLLERGADVHVSDYEFWTPLHYAVAKGEIEITKALIERGADINALNQMGGSPIYKACGGSSNELFYMLLYYNSEFTMDSFNMAVHNKRLQLDYEIIWNYVFDENEPVKIDLSTLIVLMTKSLCFDIFERIDEIIFGDLRAEYAFCEYLPLIQPQLLSNFILKYNNIVRELLLRKHVHLASVFGRYLHRDFLQETESLENLFILLDSNLASDVVANMNEDVSSISYLIQGFHKHDFPLDIVAEIIIDLLSYGVRIVSFDATILFYLYDGFSELFKLLLYMDIEIFEKNREVDPMPVLMYDVNMGIERYLSRPENCSADSLNLLLEHFAHPVLKRYCLQFEDEYDELRAENIRRKAVKLPDISSLLELARNQARSHIINRFQVKNSCQFYTVLDRIVPCAFYRKLLLFEQRIY